MLRGLRKYLNKKLEEGYEIELDQEFIEGYGPNDWYITKTTIKEKYSKEWEYLFISGLVFVKTKGYAPYITFIKRYDKLKKISLVLSYYLM